MDKLEVTMRMGDVDYSIIITDPEMIEKIKKFQTPAFSVQDALDKKMEEENNG